MVGSRKLLVGTHLVAAAVGCVLAANLNSPPAKPVAARGGFVRERPKPLTDGASLLTDAEKAVKAGYTIVKHDPDAPWNNFQKFSESLPPEADRKAAFDALLKQCTSSGLTSWKAIATGEHGEVFATLAVRYRQWLEESPAEAMKLLGTDDATFGLLMDEYGFAIFRKQCEKSDLRNFAQSIPADLKDNRGMLVTLLTESIAKRQSMEDLEWLMENRSDLVGKKVDFRIATRLGEYWPLESRDAMVPNLKGAECGIAMVWIARRMKPDEGVAWLKSWIDSGKLDEKTVENIGDNATSLNLQGGSDPFQDPSLPDKPKVPLAEQIATIRSLGGADGTNDHDLQSRMIAGQVRDFLNSDRDWLYQFRNGLVTADEVLAAALEASSDPGPAMNEFRSQIYRHLLEDDSAAASKLLSGLSESDRKWQDVYALRWWFTGVNPDRFFEVISQFDSGGDAKMDAALWDAWKAKSRSNLERFGEDYLEWVRALPEGKNRTWAIESLQEAAKNSHPRVFRAAAELLKKP